MLLAVLSAKLAAIIAIALATPVCAIEQTSSPTTEKLFERVLPLVPPATSVPQELQVVAGDRIVAIGDSITAEGAYLRYIEQVLAFHYPELRNLKIINAGIGSQKSENLLARFDRDVIVRRPTFVIINIGINDVWHRLSEPHNFDFLRGYHDNITTMVTMAQQAGIHVILLSPTIIEEKLDAEGNQRLERYASVMGKIAALKKIQFVDLHAMFCSAIERNPRSQNKGWLTSDGVHMRPLGSALMALGVLRALGVPDATTAATEIVVAPRQ